MPFPNRGILDNFNRANQAPPGSSWVGNWAANGFQVVNNQLVNLSGVWDGIVWNKTIPADQEAYATIAGIGAVATLLQFWVRRDGATDTGYYVQLSPVSGANDQISLIRRVASVDVQLGTTNTTREFVVGDAIGLQVASSTLTVWYKPSGGNWSALFSQTDTQVTAANSIAIFSNDVGWIVDDFGGGDAALIGAPISGSDSGVGSESATRTATYNSADAGTDTEVGTPKAVLSNTDSGTDAEAITLAARSTATDIGAGSEAVTPKGVLNVTDSGAGAESVSAGIPKSATDSGTSAEVITLIARPAGSDAGTDSEIVTLVTKLSLAESGTSSDVGTILTGQQVSDTDAGAGTDVSSLLRVATDIGVGADAFELAGIAGVVDTAIGIDAAQLRVPVDSEDTGMGADAASTGVLKASTQTGIGVDQATVTRSVVLSDNGAGADKLILARLYADIGSGVDTSPRRAVAVFDPGAGFERIAARRVSQAELAIGANLETTTKTHVVDSDIVAVYTLHKFASANLAATYNVRITANTSIAGSYKVKMLAGNSLHPSYDVIAFVHADLTATYVLGITRLDVDLVATYQVYGPIHLIFGIVTTPPRAKATVKMKARVTQSVRGVKV